MVSQKKEKKPTLEELLAKAKKPALLAPAMHRFYEGKVQVMPKCSIASTNDFAVWSRGALQRDTSEPRQVF